MSSRSKEIIVLASILAIIGISLGLLLEYKAIVPFYFVGIITILCEIIILIIIVLKHFDNVEKQKL